VEITFRGIEMRPPICAICDRDFRDSLSEGGYVQFKLTDDDIAKNKKLQESKMAGHPAGLEWFCKHHYVTANMYRHLTYAEVMKTIFIY
jgi:hypothetical protein